MINLRELVLTVLPQSMLIILKYCQIFLWNDFIDNFDDFSDQVCEAEKDDDNGHALNLKGKEYLLIWSLDANVWSCSTWLQT